MDRNELVFLVLGIGICLLVGGTYLGLIITLFNKTKVLIENGLEDEAVRREYLKKQAKNYKTWKVTDNIISAVLTVLFLGIFSFSLYSSYTGNDFSIAGAQTAKVVESGSMSFKNKKNTYLEENNINSQFDVFDIVITSKLPDEYELKVYDVVVYKYKDNLVVHRIISIEEPNKNHPDERWFELRGDANPASDPFPVKYSQMKSIYTGTKIPFVGCFILFLQSAWGVICLVTIIVYDIVSAVYKKKLDQVIMDRWAVLGLYLPGKWECDCDKE